MTDLDCVELAVRRTAVKLKAKADSLIPCQNHEMFELLLVELVRVIREQKGEAND
jgi:hypothetical protein